MKFFGAWVLSIFTITVAAQTPGDTLQLTPVEVMAVRAAPNTPIAQTTLSKKELERWNTGQDLPFVLQSLPSVVVNSDAGNGFGYTGIRIRGTDASRINVTINGIPYNDAESQGTFFVDIPDITSGAGSIQVIRGLGTSSNGTGAFGGAIHISTNELDKKENAQIYATAGSYGTYRLSSMYNSGVIGKNFIVTLRASVLGSDGYIDRAFSKMHALQGSAVYFDDRNTLRLNVITGKQRTYQAWNGIDAITLDTNRRYNPSGTDKPGEPYDNETDNYLQTHYQLFYNRNLNASWKFNGALFLTRGAGYYEQYKAEESMNDYGLPDYDDGQNIFSESDLIRRLHLDNYYYGGMFSFHHKKDRNDIIAGGGYNQYDGDHFGTIENIIVGAPIPPNYRWYDNDAIKKEFSAFAKWIYRIGTPWYLFTDVQWRNISYRINGFRNNPDIRQFNEYNFVNPKAGITYMRNRYKAYFSYGYAAKEPNRDDFEADVNQPPKPEKLHDFELGISRQNSKNSWGINFYYMHYRDQLVLNGKINDVGAYTRSNAAKSYRAGVELQGSWQPLNWLHTNANLTLSRNRINDFTEYIDDYDNGGQVAVFHGNTPISYSPSVTGFASVRLIPVKGLAVDLMGKYVGKQYLDNTGSSARQLDAYYLQDVRISYSLYRKEVPRYEFFINLNNVFNKKYTANGYTFSYYYDQLLTTENYYFPMAPMNFLVGANIRL